MTRRSATSPALPAERPLLPAERFARCPLLKRDAAVYTHEVP